ncbi:hypothetical protein Tcan_14560 [Toxocara canis]|uniref:Uncharacterized protein n=1 Tax=Toxocara canis TaxID=6265 RepID=A0A0B2VQ49_TOXCA|nr:hypothetical protein Tcan_14560 [Toxocara canis]
MVDGFSRSSCLRINSSSSISLTFEFTPCLKTLPFKLRILFRKVGLAWPDENSQNEKPTADQFDIGEYERKLRQNTQETINLLTNLCDFSDRLKQQQKSTLISELIKMAILFNSKLATRGTDKALSGNRANAKGDANKQPIMRTTYTCSAPTLSTLTRQIPPKTTTLLTKPTNTLNA